LLRHDLEPFALSYRYQTLVEAYEAELGGIGLGRNKRRSKL